MDFVNIMLTIRFARVGKKNKAQFRIVLQEHTVAPGGRHVEVLGSYDPHSKQALIKEDRVKYWIKTGAQMSDTVFNLLVSKGVITGEKRKVKIPAKKIEKAEEGKEAVKTEGKAEEKPAVPETPADKKSEVEKPKEEEKK